MSSLLPPGLPFHHFLPAFMPPMTPVSTAAPDLQQKLPQTAPPTPTTSSPLMSAGAKPEPHFNFNSSSIANQQNKHKEKYACKYCGKVRHDTVII